MAHRTIAPARPHRNLIAVAPVRFEALLLRVNTLGSCLPRRLWQPEAPAKLEVLLERRVVAHSGAIAVISVDIDTSKFLESDASRFLRRSVE